MTEKKELKKEKVIPDSEKSIDQKIAEARTELEEIHASISVYMTVPHTTQQKVEAQILQDRLEFRIKQYEEQLLKEKIVIYKELLAVLKK